MESRGVPVTHERISPTAWLVAYQRSITDIPLAPEVYQELENVIQERRESPESKGIDALKSTPLTIMWEARFKIVNYMLELHRANQILELAAGFSPRGLAMARDSAATYVELDLPDLVEDKRRIIEALIGSGKLLVLPNFHLLPGNALYAADVMHATSCFAGDPIAVVNEGLLGYLDLDERTTFARNVRAVLEQNGGVWITPDIEVQLSDIAPGQLTEVSARMEQVKTITGIDLLKNRLETEAAARAFFEDHGFKIERHSFMEVADRLVSDVTTPLARAVLERSVVYVMTVRG
jgi:O-methyltransferase involved in polyketide biosynthesis